MTIDEYLKLPYHYVFVKIKRRWYVEIQELKGCMADGITLQRAYTSIQNAMKTWIETALERGLEIPLPKEG